jgi:phage gpG-like protein
MSMFFDGLGQLAEHFEKLAALQDEVLHEAAETASVVVQTNVKNVFGDQSKLAPLAPSTMAERERLGFSPDEPLKRTGELMESVKRDVFENEAVIASADPIMGYHEFGYINHRTGNPVPARPAFEIGMNESEEEVVAIAELAAGAAVGMRPIVRLNPGEDT